MISLDEVRVHYRGVPVYYMFTDSGFIDAVFIIPVMKCFMGIWKVGHSVNNDLSAPSSTYCWVLSDRLAAHRSPELLEMMILNHFEAWSLPRNTAYFSSLLDLYQHAAMKKLESELSSHVVEAAIRVHEEYKPLLLAMATEALKGAFTADCIQRSFRDTCIWPWRKKEFLERARHYLDPNYEKDMASMGINATAIKHIKSIEAEFDHQVLDEATSRTVKNPVQEEKNFLFDGRDVLAASRKRQREREKEEEAKATKLKIKEELNCGKAPTKKWKNVEIAKRTCCGSKCGASWRGSKDWRVCKCGTHYICPKCRKKAELASEFTQHCQIDQ